MHNFYLDSKNLNPSLFHQEYIYNVTHYIKKKEDRYKQKNSVCPILFCTTNISIYYNVFIDVRE